MARLVAMCRPSHMSLCGATYRRRSEQRRDRLFDAGADLEDEIGEDLFLGGEVGAAEALVEGVVAGEEGAAAAGVEGHGQRAHARAARAAPLVPPRDVRVDPDLGA